MRIRSRKSQLGMSMVELLVAVALGVLLTGGILQVFVSTGQTSRAQEGLSRVQEMGRFTMSHMLPNLRMAKRLNPCVVTINTRNHLNTAAGGYDANLFDPDETLMVWEYNNTAVGDTYNVPSSFTVAGTGNAGDWTGIDGSDLPDLLAAQAVPGSDVIVIRYAEPVPSLHACGTNAIDDGFVTVNYGDCPGAGPTDSGNSAADMERMIPRGQIIYAAHCPAGRADYFQRTNNATNQNITRGSSGAAPGNSTANDWLIPTLDSELQLFSVRSVAYYVGVNAAGEPALYELDFGDGGTSATPRELVPGVENMQVLVGLALNQVVAFFGADHNRIDTEGTGAIAALNIGLLIRSTDGADSQTDTRTQDLVGITVNPQDDTRLRQAFTTTVSLRNGAVIII